MTGASSPSPVTMLKTPAGMPASSASAASASAESGVCSAGLSTNVQPAASAGADIVGDIDAAEDELASAHRLGNDFAVGAPGLFGEPLDVRRPERDFTAALGQRLALFERHQECKVVLMADDCVEPAAQYNAAFLAGFRAPS